MIEPGLPKEGEGRTTNGNPMSSPNTQISAHSYDFRRPSRFSKDHLRALQSLHERFARNVTSALSSYLRLSVRATLANATQATFADFVDIRPEPSVTYVFRASPLKGPVILGINIEEARAMLDRLCGGPGIVTNVDHDLTEIEIALLAQVGRHLCRALGDAWSAVVELNPVVEDILVTNHNVARAAAPSDIVVVLYFDFGIGDVSDGMHLCLPYLALEPIMDQLHKQAWLVDESNAERHQFEQRIRDRLLDIPLDAAVELGSVELRTHEAVNLHEGDILRLNSASGGDLVLYVAGCPLFWCRPGVKSGNNAVEIQRLTESQLVPD